MSPAPLRVLVAGGGVAALESVLALHALAGDRVAIELLTPADDFVQRPRSVLTPFTGVAAPSVSLAALPALGVHRRAGALAAVDAPAHRIVTTDGGRLGYDRLIVAPGAHRVEGVPGAVTFRGPVNAGAVEGALRAARTRALFVAPPGCGWPLPIYELALLARHELPDLRIAVVTDEPRPLDLFGRTASDALARLLHRAGIDLMPDVVPVEAADIVLVTEDDRMLSGDAVIALAQVRGPSIGGLPADDDGFIAVDAHGRVPGVDDVFAAGDATAYPVKQGGLAAQQADAAAELIAAEAGAAVTPRPCRHVLRGVLLTGEAPLYLRRDLDEDTTLARPLRVVPRGVSRTSLWWPSEKIAGRYLSGFLAHSDAVLADAPA